MLEKFIDWNPRGESLERVLMCKQIIQEYQAQGLRLTLRQLYYQFVSRGLIENTEKSYKSLGKLVSNARLAGLLSWSAIEDRGRQPEIPADYTGLEELSEAALRSYRLPRWKGQGCRAELWVEKAALAGVLWPMAGRYHVPLMVNKGYSSQSAMYEAAQRLKEAHREVYQDTGDWDAPIYIYYLGDHDPSGQDMVRDISDRLNMFLHHELNLQVRSIALTTQQVRAYDPPPNPTKVTDSRAKGYIALHGYECWEVDALEPKTLQSVIGAEFEDIIDMDLMDAIKEKEERDKDRLREAVSNLTDEEDYD